MTKMMSSFWGSLVRRPSVRRPPDGKKWSHNSGTLSFSSRFCRLDPPTIPPPSGHPSDNDNVAFGIPTDLETVRRRDRGRSGAASDREGEEARATVVSSSSKSVRRQAFQLLAGFHGAPEAPRNAAAQRSTSALKRLSFCLFACCMLE